jgi:hypothetical protein
VGSGESRIAGIWEVGGASFTGGAGCRAAGGACRAWLGGGAESFTRGAGCRAGGGACLGGAGVSFTWGGAACRVGAGFGGADAGRGGGVAAARGGGWTGRCSPVGWWWLAGRCRCEVRVGGGWSSRMGAIFALSELTRSMIACGPVSPVSSRLRRRRGARSPVSPPYMASSSATVRCCVLSGPPS